jgi:hypothetical protein
MVSRYQPTLRIDGPASAHTDAAGTRRAHSRRNSASQGDALRTATR